MSYDAVHPVAPHPLNIGLRRWWKGDPSRSSTGLVDLTGQGLPATFTNGATLGPGRDGQVTAAQFDRTVSNTKADAGLINYRNWPALTVACWFYYDGNAGGEHELLSCYSTGSPSFRYRIEPSNDRFELNVVLGTIAFLSPSDLLIRENRWHHGAFTVDTSSQVRIYLDGKVGSVAPTSPSGFADTDTTTNTSLGGFSGVEVLGGRMDDVRIYDRALSTDEIRQLAVNS